MVPSVTVYQHKVYTKQDIKSLIQEKALEYQVSYSDMYTTMDCETAHTFDPNIQSRVVRNGKREDSWGLSQIHLSAHPDITKEQATDPVFAVTFMAKEFKEKKQGMWSCWNNSHAYEKHTTSTRGSAS